MLLTQREIKQVAKKVSDGPVSTFAWEFVIVLATINHRMDSLSG